MTTQQEQGIKRELSLGEVLSKTFDLYRRDFAKYFVLFAVVGVIIGVVTALARQAFVLPTLPPTFSKLLWIWALSIVVGVIVILGLIALIVPGIILAIMFSLAFPVLLIENKGVLESMGRSRELVSHRWLKTFATYLVLGIILLVASAIISAIIKPLGVAVPVVSGFLSAFFQPLSPILMTVYYYSNLARITQPPAGQIPMAPATTAQAGMKLCPTCGTQLVSSATICFQCGARFA